MRGCIRQYTQTLMAVCSAMVLAACTTNGNAPGSAPKTTLADPVSRARIHTELAALYYQQGSMKTALEELKNAVRIDPNYAPAYGMFGLVYMQLGDRSQANDNFQKAMSLAPTNPDLHNNYGLFLCDTQQYRAGLEQLDMALANPLYATPVIALDTAERCARQMGDASLANTYHQRAMRYGGASSAAATITTPQTRQ